ncbi:MAG: HAD-IA family hydrolase [Sedimentisphaerales bacterium]|nr:HAD-IA family hydrolase [Sedimentisphaerales bacterium]
MIKAVIFDLDGTITEPFLDFDAIRQEIGLSPEDATLLEAMEKMTPPQRKRAMDIIERHEAKAVEESTLNAGAKAMLDTLRGDGIKIGILTRNKRSNAIAIARKHNLDFDAIFDREDGPVKPDAFGVLWLCEKFHVRPVESLVVGDYLYDVLAAKAAGAGAVLLKNHPKADEFAKHADFAIAKLEEIHQIIDRKLND